LTLIKPNRTASDQVAPMTDASFPSPAPSPWRRWTVETLLGLGVLLALDRLAFHGGFAAMSLHPFWIVVLFVTVQYGALAGVFAAIAASAALYAGGLPVRGGADFYVYAADLTRLPALWFLAAATLGGLRTLHIRNADQTKARLDATIANGQTIAAGFARACAEITKLETRIASDTATVDTLLRDIAALDLRSGVLSPNALADLVSHALSASAFTLWIFSTPSREGAYDQSGSPSSAVLSPAAIAAMLRQRRAIVDSDLLPDAIVAAPLVSGLGNDVYGALIVWRIGAAEDDQARIAARAEVLGRAIGALLEAQLSSDDDVRGRSSELRYSNAL